MLISKPRDEKRPDFDIHSSAQPMCASLFIGGTESTKSKSQLLSSSHLPQLFFANLKLPSIPTKEKYIRMFALGHIYLIFWPDPNGLSEYHSISMQMWVGINCISDRITFFAYDIINIIKWIWAVFTICSVEIAFLY